MNVYRNYARRAAILSPKEAISKEQVDLEVPAHTEVYLSPDEEEHQPYFAHVSISSFQDRQLLGLIPKNLVEDKVKNAIARDDEEAHKFLSQSNVKLSKSCSCEDHHGAESSYSKSPLRQSFNAVRNNYHPNLSRLVSEHINAEVEWDSPLVKIVKKWTTIKADASNSIIAILLKDIIINQGSSLYISPTTSSLLAHNILIHKTGRLISQGGYLKIWANSISPLIPGVSDHISATVQNIPWKQ